MRILAFVPAWRTIPVCMASVHALRWTGGLTIAFEYGGNSPTDRLHDLNEAVLGKANTARAMALTGGYDALLMLADDQLYTSDTIARLVACNAPIAMGLYCWRQAPHWWIATHEMSDNHHIPYGTCAGDMRTAWGNVIDVQGCGMGCTLIRREVLERIPFTRRGMHGHDFYFSVDCNSARIRQVCDCGCISGHVDSEQGVVYYPTIDGYQTEKCVVE